MTQQASGSQEKASSWQPDLIKLGYEEPLFAPAPAVQATIAAIRDSGIHSYIQETDRVALSDCDDEGEHAPTLLATLDLSHWSAIMAVATEDAAKGLARLKQAHSVLGAILDRDELELEEAKAHTRAVESYLRKANPHEKWAPDTATVPTVQLDSNSTGTANPLIGRMNIAEAHMAAIEDLSDAIQNSQVEAERAALEASGKGPAIPFLPPRAIEEQLNSKCHRTWCLSNINLLAPISVQMWKLWAFLSDEEVKAAEDHALSYEGLLKERIIITNAFPLAMFDHHKCTTTTLQVLAK